MGSVLARELSGLECLGVLLRCPPEPFEQIGAALSSASPRALQAGASTHPFHGPEALLSSSAALFIAVKVRFPLKEQNSCVPLSFRMPYRIALYTLGASG